MKKPGFLYHSQNEIQVNFSGETSEHEYRQSDLSSNRLVTKIINVALLVFSLIFIICALRFVQKISISSNQGNVSLPTNNDNTETFKILRKTSYYDFEPYLNSDISNSRNKSRRFFYLDVGCFDGRDIDYFVHFHLGEISRLGELNIIAFEPDPINLSACKTTQLRYASIKGTVIEAAVWTDNGKVRYATEKGQKSKIDQESALSVRSIDLSNWLLKNFHVDDYVYIKFTAEGAEIPILEKMVNDDSLRLIDYIEVEWNDGSSPDLEPRRIALECMFDNYGMDFLYMINPVDSRHAYNIKESFSSVPKDRGWKLKDPFARFHYKTRKEVPDLLAERLKRKERSI